MVTNVLEETATSIFMEGKRSVGSRNDQQYALTVPLLYSIYWLLHVSAVACHPQGAY
jgi:hypothetical protein